MSTVALSLMAWNTRAVTERALRALRNEQADLKRNGVRSFIVGLDNGSSDGTSEIIQQCDIPLLEAHNTGSSKARNRIVERAMEEGADRLFLLDGDIVPIPGSVDAMDTLLWDAGAEHYCIGVWPFECSSVESDATPDAKHFNRGHGESYPVVRNEMVCAFTQYGLFELDPFRQGVRFHEQGPFGEAGWGLEDNWLHMDMQERGLHSLCIVGPRYYHERHSSWNSIPKPMLHYNYEQRRMAFLDRWENSKLPDASMVCQWVARLQLKDN